MQINLREILWMLFSLGNSYEVLKEFLKELW